MEPWNLFKYLLTLSPAFTFFAKVSLAWNQHFALNIEFLLVEYGYKICKFLNSLVYESQTARKLWETYFNYYAAGI